MGGNVWAGGDGGIITVWNPQTRELRNAIEGDHVGKVFGACGVGEYVWTYAWDRRICVYHAETLEFLGSLPCYHNDAVSALVSYENEELGCHVAFSVSFDQSMITWITPLGDVKPTSPERRAIAETEPKPESEVQETDPEDKLEPEAVTAEADAAVQSEPELEGEPESKSDTDP